VRIRAFHAREQKAGTVLVLFALLVVALMGIAALTIDVGNAFLAQGQMQNATDTAAVEGARLRDYYQVNWMSNVGRRMRAEEMVRQTFDDDLHPHLRAGSDDTGTYSLHYWLEPSSNLAEDANADNARFSLGPIIRVSNSTNSEDNIGGVIVTNPAPGRNEISGSLSYLDDPRIAVNRANEPYGDMLSGRFNGELSRVEEPGTYLREDFMAAQLLSPSPSPNDVNSSESLGFLVRMRRLPASDYPDPSIDTQDSDLANRKSSHGPSVPYIFGLGTGIHRSEGSGYNPRTDGISVRATAIASSAPAFSVGYPPYDGTSIYRDNCNLGTKVMGHYGVFLSLGFWSKLTSQGDALSPFPWNTTCYYAVVEGSKLIFKGATQCGATPGSSDAPAPWVEEFINEEIGVLGDRGNVIGDRVYAVNLNAFENGADRDQDGNITDEDRAAARSRWTGITDGALGTQTGDERGFFGIYKGIVYTDPQTGTTVSTDRVIGFGFGRAALFPADEGSNTPAMLVFGPGLPSPHTTVECWVAQDNASPHLQLALLKDELEVIKPEEWAQVMTANQYFTYRSVTSNPHDYTNINRGAVLAATLVR
jgi:hypothetical protein